MAEQTPGRTESAGETTGTGGGAGGDATTAAGGAGAGGGSGAGGGEAGGAGGAGGTSARRGGRRGATADAGAAEGQTGGTTRSRSRKTAASGEADTQAAEGAKPRSRSRKAATEAGDSQGAQAGGARKAAGGSATGRGKKSTQESGPDLRGDLRQFVSSRPHGWGHDDWTGLLGNLRERGHDVSDSEQIGRQLEQERLSHQLEQVEGLKPQQARALSEHFGTLWSLRQAGVDEIAQVKNINRETAQRVHEQLR